MKQLILPLFGALPNVSNVFNKLPKFNQAASEKLKEQGMAIAAKNKSNLLDEARNIALQICPIGGRITADDVFSEMEKRQLPVSLGAASGSLFKTARWRFTGDRKKSAKVSNHSREIKVWERIA
jgi:hypothetical protein